MSRPPQSPAEGHEIQEPRLSRIYVYPVKSCGGIPLESVTLDGRGPRHDRRWMLVDGTGRFFSQRRLPRMALISVSVASENLLLDAPGMQTLTLPLEPSSNELGDLLTVRIFGDETQGAAVDAEADRWFGEFLGVDCRLVYMPDSVTRPVDPRYARRDDHVGFADGFPLLMFSEASLMDLNSRLRVPVNEDRFRPNLVISGAEAFAEDGWRRLRIGELEFRVAKPCARCAITTVDQATAERGEEPLRTLTGYRRTADKVLFGQNLAHDWPGEIQAGERVEVLEGE